VSLASSVVKAFIKNNGYDRVDKNRYPGIVKEMFGKNVTSEQLKSMSGEDLIATIVGKDR